MKWSFLLFPCFTLPFHLHDSQHFASCQPQQPQQPQQHDNLADEMTPNEYTNDNTNHNKNHANANSKNAKENTSQTVPFFHHASLVSILSLYPTTEHETTQDDPNQDKNAALAAAALEPTWQDLRRALKEYKLEIARGLQTLGKAEMVARESERILLARREDHNGSSKSKSKSKSNSKSREFFSLADQLKKRRGRLAEILEQDVNVLEGFLQPFPIVQALPLADKNVMEPTISQTQTEEAPPADEEKQNAQPSPSFSSSSSSSSSLSKEWILLQPPRYSSSTTTTTATTTTLNTDSTFNNYATTYNSNTNDENQPSACYNTVQGIVAHMVRDYTLKGRNIRKSTYGWCVDQLQHWRMRQQEKEEEVEVEEWRVLVPGAGLGRLALDVASLGGKFSESAPRYRVEANDCSVVMAAVAYRFFNRASDGDNDEGPFGGVIHPFATDAFSNEIDAEYRFEAVPFPDDHNQNHENPHHNNCHANRNGTPKQKGQQDKTEKKKDTCTSQNEANAPNKHKHDKPFHLSYTLGDFVHIYTLPSRQSTFQAVITSFFLDTAPNVYEYLATIFHVLTCKGIWINVGPVQWHAAALVHPTVQDLKRLLEEFGFEILVWRVEEEVVGYRGEESYGIGGGGGGAFRSTRMDGYRPLRFVAMKKGLQAGDRDGDGYGDGHGDGEENLLRKMGEVRHGVNTFSLSSNHQKEDL